MQPENASITAHPALPSGAPRAHSYIALLRLVPFLFPAIFIYAAYTGSIAVLYAAVISHLALIALEATLGKRFSDIAIPTFAPESDAFEEACLAAWAVMHFATFISVIYLILNARPTAIQIFSVAAVFSYSINTFSATVGHELLHRQTLRCRLVSDFLYTAMMYPHFSTVHLVSHHRWAGTERDCQTPRKGQPIYAYLLQAFWGGVQSVRSARARSLDLRLSHRLLFSVVLLLAPIVAGIPSITCFLVIQGVFSFILIETLNYIQHYETAEGEPKSQHPCSLSHTTQDLNFVSRMMLFNLPLHVSHHAQHDLTYPHLRAVSGVRTRRMGYWTSFWLAWTPLLWQHFGEGTAADLVRSRQND